MTQSQSKTDQNAQRDRSDQTSGKQEPAERVDDTTVLADINESEADGDSAEQTPEKQPKAVLGQINDPTPR